MELANHLVVSGETLTSIAAQYGTTTNELQRLNRFIQNADYVRAGWNLSVPAPSSVSAASAVKTAASPAAAAAPASNDSSHNATAFGKEPSVPDSCKAPGEEALPPCATTYATAIYVTKERQFWLLPEKLSEAIQEALQELADSVSPEKSPEERKRGLDELGLLEYFMEPKLTNFLEGEDLQRAQVIEAEFPEIANRSRAWQRLSDARELPDSPFNRPPMGNPFTAEGRAAARHLERTLVEVRQATARLDALHYEWQRLEAKALLQAKEEGYTYENGALFSKEAMEARRRVQDYLSKRSQVMNEGQLPDYDVALLADTLAKAKSRHQAVQNCTKQCRGKVKSYSVWLRASRGKLDFIDYVESIIKVADYGLALPEFALIPASEGDVTAGVTVFRQYLDAQLKQQEVNDRLQTKYRNWVESTGSNMRAPAGLVAAERAEWEALQQVQKDLKRQAELNVQNGETQRHLLWEPEHFQPQPAERLVRAGFPLSEMSLPDNPESPVRALSLFNLEGIAEQLKKDIKTKPVDAAVKGIQRIPTDTSGKRSSEQSLLEAWLENAGGFKIGDQASDWFDEDGWFEMEKFYAYLQQEKLKVDSLEDAAVRADWGLRLKQVLFSADIRDDMRLFDSSPQAQLVRCLTPPQSNIHSSASAAGPSFSVAEGLQASVQASLSIDLARGEVEIFSVDYPARSAAREITVHYQNHAGEMLPMSLGRYSMHLSARAWGYAGASLLLAARIGLTPNGPLWGKPALSTEEPATRPSAGSPPRTVSHNSTHTSAPVTTGRGPSVNVQDGVQASFNLFAGVQAGILLTGALNWAPPKGTAALRTIPGNGVGSIETSDANQWLSMAELAGGLGGGIGLGLKGDAMLSLHNGRLVLKLKAAAVAGAGVSGEFSFAVSYQGMVELINIYRRELHRNHGRPLDWIDPEAADLISKINVLSAAGLDAELLLGMTMWVGHRPVMQVDIIMTLYESLLSRPGRAGGVALAIMEYENVNELQKWFVEAVPEALGPLLLTLSSTPRSFTVTETKVTPAGVRTHSVEYTSEQAQALQQRAIDRVLGWIVTAARAGNSMPAAQHQFEQACMRMNQYGVLPEKTGQTYCENRLKLDLFMEMAALRNDPLIVSAKIRYNQLIKLLGAQADRHCKISESRLPFFNPSANYEPQ